MEAGLTGFIAGSPTPCTTDELALPQSGELGPRLLANAGLGRTFGAELLLRKSLTRNFYAWLSYTLSKSQIRDAPGP